MDADARWLFFNDFCVNATSASEVRQDFGGQKVPCLLFFSKVNADDEPLWMKNPSTSGMHTASHGIHTQQYLIHHGTPCNKNGWSAVNSFIVVIESGCRYPVRCVSYHQLSLSHRTFCTLKWWKRPLYYFVPTPGCCSCQSEIGSFSLKTTLVEVENAQIPWWNIPIFHCIYLFLNFMAGIQSNWCIDWQDAAYYLVLCEPSQHNTDCVFSIGCLDIGLF